MEFWKPVPMRSARVALPLALVLFAALCVGVLLLDQFATSGPKTADDTAVKSSPNASQMAKPSASDGVTERSVSTGSTDGDVISTVETGARSPRIPWPLPDDHSEAVEQIRKEELELIGLPEELSIGGSNEDVYPVSTVRDAATGESILDAQVLATFFYFTLTFIYLFYNFVCLLIFLDLNLLFGIRQLLKKIKKFFGVE